MRPRNYGSSSLRSTTIKDFGDGGVGGEDCLIQYAGSGIEFIRHMRKRRDDPPAVIGSDVVQPDPRPNDSWRRNESMRNQP